MVFFILRLWHSMVLLHHPLPDREQQPGAHHLPAAHRRVHASLPRQGVELAERSYVHGGSLVWFFHEPRSPPHHGHSCVPPPVLQDAILPCRRSHSAHQACARSLLLEGRYSHSPCSMAIIQLLPICRGRRRYCVLQEHQINIHVLICASVLVIL